MNRLLTSVRPDPGERIKELNVRATEMTHTQ